MFRTRREFHLVCVALLSGCATPPPPTPLPPPAPAPPVRAVHHDRSKALPRAEPPLLPEYPCETRKWTEPGEKVPPSGRLLPELIQKIIRSHYDKLRQCYENGLRKDPDLLGKVTVRFAIGRSGDVTDARPICTSLPDSEAVRCIVDNYKIMKFPEPDGGHEVVVVYPIMFSQDD